MAKNRRFRSLAARGPSQNLYTENFKSAYINTKHLLAFKLRPLGCNNVLFDM